jgi:hypothetical protein
MQKLGAKSRRMTAVGPELRFAAMQQDVGNGGRPDGRRTRPEPPFLTRSDGFADRGYCFKQGSVLYVSSRARASSTNSGMFA